MSALGDLRRVRLFDEKLALGWEGDLLRCRLHLLLSPEGHIHCPGGDPVQMLQTLLSGTPIELISAGLEQLIGAGWIAWCPRMRTLLKDGFSAGQEKSGGKKSNLRINRDKRRRQKAKTQLEQLRRQTVSVLYQEVAGQVVPPLGGHQTDPRTVATDPRTVAPPTREGSLGRPENGRRPEKGRSTDPRTVANDPRRVGLGGKGGSGVWGIDGSKSKPQPQTPSAAPANYTESVWRAWLEARGEDLGSRCSQRDEQLIAEWFAAGVSVQMVADQLAEEVAADRMARAGSLRYVDKALRRELATDRAPAWQGSASGEPATASPAQLQSVHQILTVLALRLPHPEGGEHEHDAHPEVEALRALDLSPSDAAHEIRALGLGSSAAIDLCLSDLQQLEEVPCGQTATG